VAARENGLADSLSLSLANACNPLVQAHPPWVQDNTKVAVSPYCFPPLCSVSRRPIWAGTRIDNLLVGPGTPPGVETPTVWRHEKTLKTIPAQTDANHPACHRNIRPSCKA
jgi:hypothetical protein